MLPPPPGLLSMTMVHLVAALIFSPTRRESVSVPPPGGNGTTMRIGLSGHFAWANAWMGSAASAATAARLSKRRFIASSSWDGSGPLHSVVDHRCRLLHNFPLSFT